MSDPYETEREERGVNSGMDGEPDDWREPDELLKQRIESAYQTYCTIHLVNWLHPGSPLVRHKRDMKVEGS